MENQKNFIKLRIDNDEDEFHLLKIPKGIDPNVLLQAKIDPFKKSKVKTQCEVFYLKPISDESGPKYFLGSDGSKKLRPLSVLQLTKSVPDENMKGEQSHFQQYEEKNNKKPLPDKNEVKIELQKEIELKIEQALQRVREEKLKKKQALSNKKHDKSLLISQILEAKFKSNISTNGETTKELNSFDKSSRSFQFEKDNEVHKNKKKRKKNSEHEVGTSFQEHNIKSAIHDVSHLKDSAYVESPNPSKKEYANFDSDINKELQLDAECILNKKKKKKIHNQCEISINMENAKELGSSDITSGNVQFKKDNMVPKAKKKRKRNKKHKVENLQKEFQLDADLSESISNRKKKKKNHSQCKISINMENSKELGSLDTTLTCNLTKDNLMHKEKKKRRKKRKNRKYEIKNKVQDQDIKSKFQY